MPTLNRRLADTMTASAVVAEVIEHTLPASGVTVRLRVLPHLDVVKAGAGAMAKVVPMANRADRRATGQRGPVAVEDDEDEGDAWLDALCKALVRSVIDDDGDPVFVNRGQVSAWLNALDPRDFRAMLEVAGGIVSTSALQLPTDDDVVEDVIVVGKASSRSGRTSSRSTTHASSSAASPRSSARSPRLKST